jgi:hypothetical protein
MTTSSLVELVFLFPKIDKNHPFIDEKKLFIERFCVLLTY